MYGRPYGGYSNYGGASYGGGSRSYSRRPYARKTKMPKGIKAFKRLSKKFPSRLFGAAYYKRGSPPSLELFGPSYALANAQQKANRTQSGFSGKGKYTGRGGFYGGAIGAGGAGWASGWDPTAMSAGYQIGSAIQDYAFGGSGAYNSLVNPKPDDTAVPRMRSSVDETGALTIRHREYVQDIAGSLTFENTSYLINPSNSELFPFLSQFACNFDEYEFQQLIIHFKSVTTDLSTTSQQMGTVIMVCDYNAGTSHEFTNKIQMMQYDGSVSARISEPITFGVECDPSKNALGGIKYVPPMGQTPVGEDPKTYHMGLFQIAVNQSVAQGQIGELWVEYNVVLRKPKFCQAIGLDLPYMSFVTAPPANPGTMNGVPPSGQYSYASGTVIGGTPQVPGQLAKNQCSFNNSTLWVGGAYAGNLLAHLQLLRAGSISNRVGTERWIMSNCTTTTGSGIPAQWAVFHLPDSLGTGNYDIDVNVVIPTGWDTTTDIELAMSSNITATKGYVLYKDGGNMRVTFNVQSSAINSQLNVTVGGVPPTGTFIALPFWTGNSGGALQNVTRTCVVVSKSNPNKFGI